MTDSDTQTPSVAVFRPDDDRLADAISLLESLGADPVPDPMLAIEPTGVGPRSDADYTVLTSKTGVELAADAGWQPGETTVCAIGNRTADTLRASGYTVDLVPETFSSAGLVDALEDSVDGRQIEVARSDHGSDVLTDGLNAAGAYVHETVLYRLVRPDGAGESAKRAAAGEIDAVLFTSSLTVENFLAAAAERGCTELTVNHLNDPLTVVACIGEPTRETAESAGISVDTVPDQADFERLARAAVEATRTESESESESESE